MDEKSRKGVNMGSAYKCDRCGKLYEKNAVAARKKFKLTKLDEYRGRQLDLCESCMKSLEKWWEKVAHEAN